MTGTSFIKFGFLLGNAVKNLYRHRKRYILYAVIFLAALTVFFCAVTIHSAADAVLDTDLDIYAPGGVWLPVEELDLTGAVYSREQVKAADEAASLTLRIVWLTGLAAALLVHYTIRFLCHVRMTEYAVICSAGAGMHTVLFSAALELLLFLTGIYTAGIFSGFGSVHLLKALGKVPGWLSFSLPGWPVCGAGMGCIVLILLFRTLALARAFRRTAPIRLLAEHT
ncbi:MAG: hypothetical protein IJ480_02165 [Clostridia bacterium]|nr:hypothetical protein [Clostridia bacterium]